MPKGSMYVSAPHKSDVDGSFQELKFCAECAYILRNADRQSFKHGNFTEHDRLLFLIIFFCIFGCV